MTAVDGSARAAALRRNLVLAALAPSPPPAAPLELELVRLDHHDVVHETGQPTAAALFPLTCVVSIAARNGADALDVTTVGCEGLVGLSGLLGADVHDTDAVCRVPGEALRLPIAAARQLLTDDNAGLAVLHRYVRSTIAHLMQRTACTRAHSSEARCASWLLRTSDRVGADAFELSHATLATMLGVRRATVSDSLSLLQRNGVVRSTRGTVTVLARSALQTAACSCYATLHRAPPATSA